MNIRKTITISYIGLIFQSCSAQTDRLNIMAVQRADLQENGSIGDIFHGELDKEIDKLEREGFIGEPSDTDDVDIKKHLMFVLCHSLKFKRRTTPIQERIDFFNTDANSEGLMYRAADATEKEDDERKKIAFELKHLFTEKDPNQVENMRKIEKGSAPDVEVKHKFLLVKRIKEPGSGEQKIHIDHLLKDNTNTIELPKELYEDKTKYLDKIISAPEEDIKRYSKKYWRQRFLKL